MDGGGPGAFGRNTWIKQVRKEDGDLVENVDPQSTREINIGGKATVWMGKGDRLLIETPGAGAWGAADKETLKVFKEGHTPSWEPRGSLAERASAQASFGP